MPLPSNLIPARLRVSGLCPLCWQQGALNDVHPDGLDLARGGSSVRNLSTTRVILQVYYLYSILSMVPTEILESFNTNVLTPL